jgi:O-succinylbenzoic acid--CoA ligase
LVEANLECPSCLRAVVIGGAALSAELYFKARKLGWPVLPSYGMTEVGSQIATAEIKSLESALEFPKLKILNHIKLRLGKDHLLEVKSDSLMAGYGQKVNGEFFWHEVQTGAWYKTADRGVIADKYVQPLGRIDDFIKIKGEGVNLTILRERLLQLPEIQRSNLSQSLVLVDLPDIRDGARLALITENIQQPIAAEIQKTFNSESTGVEKISEIFSVDKIPRTALGKVLWKTLQTQIQEKVGLNGK